MVVMVVEMMILSKAQSSCNWLSISNGIISGIDPLTSKWIISYLTTQTTKEDSTAKRSGISFSESRISRTIVWKPYGSLSVSINRILMFSHEESSGLSPDEKTRLLISMLGLYALIEFKLRIDRIILKNHEHFRN